MWPVARACLDSRLRRFRSAEWKPLLPTWLGQRLASAWLNRWMVVKATCEEDLPGRLDSHADHDKEGERIIIDYLWPDCG